MISAITQSTVRNTLLLLRIPFSALLAPVYFLALSQSPAIDVWSALWTFIILHLMVYPASNGYNSYVDRDTGSIGGIEHPPLPTALLYFVTLTLDVLAVIFSIVAVSTAFATMVILYIIASRLYSAPVTRLKRYPVISFLIVIFFQGAFACYMSMTGISGALPYDGLPLNWILLASTCQIAGVYPLTQVFQHRQDQEAGIRTISMALSVRGTFIFSALMLLASELCFLRYFFLAGTLHHFFILQAFLLPPVIYFLKWIRLAFKDSAAADYQHTMTMSWLSALCMNTCFIILFFLRG